MTPRVSATPGANILPTPQDCLAAHDLPQRWSGRARFVILDLDLGAGQNFLATWRAWQADPNRPLRLHYLALGPVPIGSESVAPPLRALWPVATDGFHRVILDQGRVTLDLMFGAQETSLSQIDARVDAFFPAAPDATLHAVFAGRKPQATQAAPQDRRAIVIGAGLAGAAACERLVARGWDVTLIERHAAPAQEASGNLAGVFMPQLSKDDNHAARLSRAAFLFALRQWERLGGVGSAFGGARCGVLQLARNAAHAQVQRRIAAIWNYPHEFAQWLEPDAASAKLGAVAPDGAWWFGQGGWAHPAGVCQAMLDACGARLVRQFSSEAVQLLRDNGQWQVLDRDGILARAPTVILANGCAATGFAQAAQLPLSAVRGQVTHLLPGTLPPLPMVVCREAYLTPPSQGMVCVGATYDMDGERTLRASSQQENLKKMAAILGRGSGGGGPPPLRGRVGFRCVAPDRLPLVGALPNLLAAGARAKPLERLRDVPRWPGLYGLLGYASRGLIWAPLAAELLAAQIENEPLPLEACLAAALDPARFLLKAQRSPSAR